MPSVCLCSAADRRCCGADGPVDQAGSGERQEGGRGRRSGSDRAEVIRQKALGRAARLPAVTVLCPPPHRLQQDRLEAARMAEDMARKAAAEAVRQLEEEHSAKILIDSPPESNEP